MHLLLGQDPTFNKTRFWKTRYICKERNLNWFEGIPRKMSRYIRFSEWLVEVIYARSRLLMANGWFGKRIYIWFILFRELVAEVIYARSGWLTIAMKKWQSFNRSSSDRELWLKNIGRGGKRNLGEEMCDVTTLPMTSVWFSFGFCLALFCFVVFVRVNYRPCSCSCPKTRFWEKSCFLRIKIVLC